MPVWPLVLQCPADEVYSLSHLALHAGILLRPTVLDGMPLGQERSAAAILVDWEAGLLQVCSSM